MQSQKILVVDDSSTVRTVLRQFLAEAGYEVVVASDGEEGLRLVSEERPNLLILDIQMPGMDGYSLCQAVKEMGQPWDLVPVIFVTSLESNALSLLGNQMGAYLKKPLCRDTVLDAVRCALEHFETQEVGC